MADTLLDQFGLYDPTLKPHSMTRGHGGSGGYCLILAATATQTVQDSTTYYYGISAVTAASHTTQGAFEVVIPQRGIIRGYSLSFRVTVLGTGEYIPIDLLINGTTSVGSQSIVLSATPTKYSFSGINQSVSEGDTIELRMVCPVWATNPQFTFNGSIYID